jgi:steroid 5-alpha reductase family enzyme
MSSLSSLVASNAALVGALVTTLWVVSIPLRDVSIIDPWWSMGFLLVTVHTIVRTGWAPEKALLVGLVALWALRLWVHLLFRSRGKPEDPRYAAFRRRFGAERYWWLSFFQVFLLQGVLVVVISAPLQVAASAPPPDPIAPLDIVGSAVVVAGFLFEAVADWQLSRYTRHPNYFGEAVLGWGFWMFSLGHPYGWATALAPALMTFLLLKVSGVSLLDEHMKATKPGFAGYMRRTSGFVPRRPRAE